VSHSTDRVRLRHGRRNQRAVRVRCVRQRGRRDRRPQPPYGISVRRARPADRNDAARPGRRRRARIARLRLYVPLFVSTGVGADFDGQGWRAHGRGAGGGREHRKEGRGWGVWGAGTGASGPAPQAPREELPPPHSAIGPASRPPPRSAHGGDGPSARP
jgi:hypothetical protein